MSKEATFIILLVLLIFLIMSPFVIILDLGYDVSFLIALIILMVWSMIIHIMQKIEINNYQRRNNDE